MAHGFSTSGDGAESAAEVEAGRDVSRAIMHCCLAIRMTDSRRRSLALWSALRSLIEARFAEEEKD